MKRLILISMMVLCLLFSGASFAGDKEEAQYRVEVKIVYNSVDAKEMSKLLRDIGEDHAKACKVEFNVKKVDDRNDYITFFTGSSTVTIDEDGNLIESN